MPESLHPAATHNLPSFITAPGETDVLMVAMAVILLLCVLGFGLVFLRLHTLPERIAHRSHKLQFEIVAVLGLIALFTHMHIFWVAGLLLALIDLPDFGTPLNRIAGSAEKIAGISAGSGAVDPTIEDSAGKHIDKASDSPSKTDAVAKESDRVFAVPAEPAIDKTSKKELTHA
jgi:hypothetical protein